MRFFLFHLHCTKIAINGFRPITKEEKAIFNPTLNPVFENAEAKLVFGKK